MLAAPLAAALPMVGCVAPAPPEAPDRYVAPDFTPLAVGSQVLLLHLDANEPAYRSGDEAVRTRVEAALADMGYRVARLQPDDYRLALRAEFEPLQRSTAAPRWGQLAEAELRALALVSRAALEVTGAQLLLRTRVLNRPAAIWQSYVKWDGVSRPILFEDAKPGEVTVNFQGTAAGISLEAIATDRAGRLRIKHYGGLALPFRASRKGLPLPVDQPLSDPAQVQQAVDIALAPLKGR